mmetsp:Transcript_21130/g.31137  ORF Transcript_21130/g.31137 Transcript_21130/m.31137 type:complete len:98 (+) Transcript_21130:186-479(+)
MSHFNLQSPLRHTASDAQLSGLFTSQGKPTPGTPLLLPGTSPLLSVSGRFTVRTHVKESGSQTAPDRQLVMLHDLQNPSRQMLDLQLPPAKQGLPGL